VAWLSGKQGDAYKTGYMYTFLMNKFDDNEDVAKSYALRLLIHYMGDIVQPLHCENRYSKLYPDSDKGGNEFPLPYHYGVDELHALWDKVLYDQRTNIARPFTEESWTDFQVQIDDTMDTYAYAVKDPSVYETIDYVAMSEESFDIAVTLYDGVTENVTVS